MSSVAVAERMAIYHWDKLAERDRRVWAGIMVLALACAFAARAAAAEPIESFAVTTSSSQAGGHPDVTASFALQEPGEKTASSVLLEPPAGQLLVPTSVPLCPGSDFATANCSPQTQVGSVTLRGVREGNDNFLFGTAAVYNLVAASGDLGRIGFVIPTIDIPVEGPLTLRSESDYGLRIKVEGLPSQDPLGSATLRLWGVPADPSHDAERLPEGTTGCPGSESLSCEEPSASVHHLPRQLPRLAVLDARGSDHARSGNAHHALNGDSEADRLRSAFLQSVHLRLNGNRCHGLRDGDGPYGRPPADPEPDHADAVAAPLQHDRPPRPRRQREAGRGPGLLPAAGQARRRGAGDLPGSLEAWTDQG
jgi:hypothetical protein